MLTVINWGEYSSFLYELGEIFQTIHRDSPSSIKSKVNYAGSISVPTQNRKKSAGRPHDHGQSNRARPLQYATGRHEDTRT